MTVVLNPLLFTLIMDSLFESLSVTSENHFQYHLKLGKLWTKENNSKSQTCIIILDDGITSTYQNCCLNPSNIEV